MALESWTISGCFGVDGRLPECSRRKPFHNVASRRSPRTIIAVFDFKKEIPVEMAKPLIATKPVSAVAANAARLSIASGVLFVLLLGSLHLLEPEFDPTWRFISEYALGNFGWMMRLAFLALATSLAERMKGALELGVKSGCVVPLICHGNVLGTLAIASLRESAFTESDAEMLSQIGGRWQRR
jgi:hypothetical protein